MIVFDANSKPVAMYESSRGNRTEDALAALRKLAERAGIPFYLDDREVPPPPKQPAVRRRVDLWG